MRIDRDQQRLRLDGRFDAHTVPQVAIALDAIAAEHPTVRLDLHDVDFIDSSGLATLVRAHKVCAAAGGALVIEAISQPVRIILELTGLDVVLLAGASA